jgi:hypothetical protein
MVCYNNCEGADIMRKIIVFVLISIIFLLTGCKDNDDFESKVADLEEKIGILEQQNAQYTDAFAVLNDKISQLEYENATLSDEIVVLDSKLGLSIDSLDTLIIEYDVIKSIVEELQSETGFSSEIFNDLDTILDPYSTGNYIFYYLGEINGVLLFKTGLNPDYEEHICSLAIIPPTDLGNGFFIRGGSNGCYSKTIAVKEGEMFVISGHDYYDSTELGLTVEELCSVGGVCFYNPDKDND